MTNYRKIYESYHGIKIPKDSNGRSYEIHHINGDRGDNSIENLKCVSAEEHFNIHLTQNDYGACTLLGLKLNKPAAELSSISSLTQIKRVKDGTHPFLGGKVQYETAEKLLSLGTHIFLDDDFKRNTAKITSEWHREKVKLGSHPLQNQPKTPCIHCGKLMTPGNMSRFHGDKCKFK